MPRGHWKIFLHASFYFPSEKMKEARDKNYGNSSTILKSRNEERADFTFHDIILLILMRKIV